MAMGSLTNIAYPVTTDVAMAYDGLNRLTMEDGPVSDDAMVFTCNRGRIACESDKVLA